jgi:hypothetical protein
MTSNNSNNNQHQVIENPSIITSNNKRQPRATCPICLKPAVMYSYVTPQGKKRLTFEHRDEPPIGEYTYRGDRVFRYRRCSGGVVSQEGLPLISEPQQQQAAAAALPKKKKRGRPPLAYTKVVEPDWKTQYLELRSKYDAICNLVKGANEICQS